MKPIYLDYAATTPVDLEVLRAMMPYFSDEFGNPGSVHSFGQRASTAVFTSRQKIAKVLGAHYSEIIFTGSATEANNLALSVKGKVIASTIEHDSILSPLKENRKAVYISVSKSGALNLSELEKSITTDTSLVSVIYANNETAVIQDIKRIAETIKKKNPNTLVHIDAVQAFQYLDCKPEKLGVDMMTLSAHKIYGPKGIGLLYANKKAREKLKALVAGGGQEDGLRSGTENVASIVGFAHAIESADKNRTREIKRTGELRDYLWREIKKIFPMAKLNGSETKRLPNNINFYSPGLNAEQALITLDLSGIAISSGPACSARSIGPSHVLEAMGYDNTRAKNSLRITLGKQTTKTELNKLVAQIKKSGII